MQFETSQMWRKYNKNYEIALFYNIMFIFQYDGQLITKIMTYNNYY